jgi:glucuronosyltransferase
MNSITSLIIIFVLIFATSDALKILAILPFPGPSHYYMFKVYISELVKRGHEVTSISAFKYGAPLSNYTEILIEPQWSFGDTCKFILKRI